MTNLKKSNTTPLVSSSLIDLRTFLHPPHPGFLLEVFLLYYIRYPLSLQHVRMSPSSKRAPFCSQRETKVFRLQDSRPSR